jgi:hypothetical protein
LIKDYGTLTDKQILNRPFRIRRRREMREQLAQAMAGWLGSRRQRT